MNPIEERIAILVAEEKRLMEYITSLRQELTKSDASMVSIRGGLIELRLLLPKEEVKEEEEITEEE